MCCWISWVCTVWHSNRIEWIREFHSFGRFGVINLYTPMAIVVFLFLGKMPSDAQVNWQTSGWWMYVFIMRSYQQRYKIPTESDWQQNIYMLSAFVVLVLVKCIRMAFIIVLQCQHRQPKQIQIAKALGSTLLTNVKIHNTHALDWMSWINIDINCSPQPAD